MSDAGTAAAEAGQQQQQAAAGQQQQQAAAATGEPWFKGVSGVDDEIIGHLQNRGLDKKSAAEAAISEARAYREAQKLLGVPPEQLVRIPKDANDQEGWAKLHERLGVPTDLTKYDFSDVKFTDGSAVEDDFVKSLREFAGSTKLTVDAAKSVARFIVKQIEASEAADTAEYASKLANEQTILKTNWGSNAAVNKVVAENAAAKLGVKPEEIAALEKGVGYARVMEMFRNIGVRMGEDQFVNGGQPGGAMTVEQAKATLAQREADKDWVAKFERGDSAAKNEWNNLTRVIAGV